MKKDTKDSKEGTVNTTTSTDTTKPQVKLGVFEEDDYFEEFDDEEYNEGVVKESDIDFKQWQEEWEDEEINDQFEKVLRKEMEAFKAK